MSDTHGWLEGIAAPSPDDTTKCVSCGLCLPHCPTFRVTGREDASPRGRVTAMRAVQDGLAGVDETFVRMMDECLACRACETACPSGVPYGRMIEAARVQAEAARPVRARIARRAGVGWVFRHPLAIGVMGTGMAISQRLGLDRLAPAALREAAPPVGLGQLVRRVPGRLGTGPVAAVLTGCVMDVAQRQVQAATMRAVAGAGYTAVRGRPRGCCGALAMHHGHPETARALARERIAEFEDAEIIVANAAGCSNHMKLWGELLADDPVWAPRAEEAAAKVRDLLELPLRPAMSLSGTVAIHDACHHVNGQDLRAPIRQITTATGATPVEVPDGGRCCGAAGLYSVFEPELAAELGRQKAAAIAATGATTVAVANPGCAMQIERHLRAIHAPVRVVHPARFAGG
ncbi:MAG: (Fe-S)-binding protein [Thermoleophilia bacterium]|nr:(Fe-S)-binding protein [Thermoleophilia bacterium]